MKNPNTTVLLLVLIVLASLWASGRAARIFNVVFG